LVIASIVCAFATRAAASVPGTVSYSSNILEQNTNWTHALQLQRFDPGMGLLQSVEITVHDTVIGSVKLESTDAMPSTVTTQFSSFLRIVSPDTTVLELPIPMATYQDTLGSFDGTIDFAGTSGLSHTEISVTHSLVHLVPPTASLAEFMGTEGAPGTLTVNVTALGTSSSAGPGNIVSQFKQRAFAVVTVTYGFLGNTPPTFTGCSPTLMASAGVPFTHQICAMDADSSAPVTLTVSGLPAGATLTPSLPAAGNPVCTTLNWTPTSAQVGSTTITFTATDANERTTTCQVTVLTAECHMVFGLGTGNTQIILFGQLFGTQLSEIRRSFPVTMEDHPALPWVALPQTFFVQVLMYNPLVFPTNPDQWTSVMRVDKVLAGQTVQTSHLGNENGMHLFVQEFVDSNGVHRVRFPFTIDGM
jgi:hypothetical protein